MDEDRSNIYYSTDKNPCPPNNFLCGGKCMSNSFKCDLNQDCESGEDEENCLYYNETVCEEVLQDITTEPCYIKYNSTGLLNSKVHFPFKTITNCSKEMKCAKGFYKCKTVNYCISIQQVCDGAPNCLENDDEIGCGNSYCSFITKNFFNIFFTF